MPKIRLVLAIFLAVLLMPNISQALNAPGSLIRIYDNNKKFVRQFKVYDENLKFGVNALAEDFNNDGKVEIITVPQEGGGPQVMMMNLKGKLLIPGFFAYSADFRGGVNIASADVDGDGIMELVLAPASNATSLIKIYSLKKNKIRLISEFNAYPDFFKGGAFVAAGDINGDKKDEIITGAGQGGGPQVLVLNKRGKILKNFFPFSTDYHGGVSVASGNLDKDKFDEIIVGKAQDSQAIVKVYDSDAKKVISEFQAYPGDVKYGVNLQANDVNRDNKDEIITGPASMGGPHVRIFNKKGKNLDNFFSHEDNFRGCTKTQYSKKAKLYISTFSLESKRYISGPKVALTFDDGYSSPNGSLNKILDILKEHNLQVTFFLLGDWIKNHPSEMQRIINDGHEIGNHSYNHPLFTRLSEAQIRNEIIANEILIKQFGVDPKPIFRYPYGGHNANTDAIIKSLGYNYYQWTASTGDTGPNKNNYASVLNGALSGLHDKSIILAHCSNDVTASALNQIIDSIQGAGYNIVRISELEN